MKLLLENQDVSARIVEEAVCNDEGAWAFDEVVIALTCRDMYRICSAVVSRYDRSNEERYYRIRRGMDDVRDEALAKCWITRKGYDNDYEVMEMEEKEHQREKGGKFKSSLESMLTSIERMEWYIDTFAETWENVYMCNELQKQIASSGHTGAMQSVMGRLDPSKTWKSVYSYTVMNAAIKAGKLHMVKYLRDMGFQWNFSSTWIARYSYYQRNYRKTYRLQIPFERIEKEEVRVFAYMWSEDCPGMVEWCKESRDRNSDKALWMNIFSIAE